jgi:DNA-binding beta-propeller fold protein YncE
VSTIAGTGIAGYADGVATQAMLNLPYGIAVDVDDTLYVCDYNNHKIRKISKQGMKVVENH